MASLKIGIIFLLANLLFHRQCNCQIISPKVFDSIRNEERIKYYDINSKCLGCCNAIECMGFNVLFYKVTFDRLDSSLVLKGRTYIAISQNKKDTLGLGNAQIFEATPTNDKLSKINKIAFSYYKKSGNYTRPNIFPFRMGEFSIKIKIKEGRKIYFMRPGFFLIEYDVNKLLKMLPSA